MLPRGVAFFFFVLALSLNIINDGNVYQYGYMWLGIFLLWLVYIQIKDPYFNLTDQEENQRIIIFYIFQATTLTILFIFGLILTLAPETNPLTDDTWSWVLLISSLLMNFIVLFIQSNHPIPAGAVVYRNGLIYTSGMQYVPLWPMFKYDVSICLEQNY